MAQKFQIEVTVEAPKGLSVQKSCEEVKLLSEFLGYDLTFEFNGVEITTANKSISEMVNSYMMSRG